jgi:hypothetical protein
MDKKDLKIGDVIRFHSWEIGGFLFGIIIEHEDDQYHSKLNIWRPKDIYYLQAHGIDNITLIKIESNVNEYELYDFRDLIKEAQDNSVYYNLR